MTQVSKSLLIDAARLARMAYVSPEKVLALYEAVHSGSVSSQDDIETVEVLKKVTSPPTFFNDVYSDAQGYGIHYRSPEGPICMLVYRGTSNLADCVADGDVQLVPLKTYLTTAPKGVLVHAGFSGQFSTLELQSNEFLQKTYDISDDNDSNDIDRVAPLSDIPAPLADGDNAPVSEQLTEDSNPDEIRQISQDLLKPLAETESNESGENKLGKFLNGPPLLVIGHSLGSAVGAIGAMVFSLKYGDGVSYIGFGTPRVGNGAWATLFNDTIDTSIRVKHGRDPVDACIPPVIYQHIGSKIHVGSPDPFPDICFLNDICDHDMDQYVIHLKQDDTSEKPLKWLPYIIGFLVNTPVAFYDYVRSLAFYSPWQ